MDGGRELHDSITMTTCGGCEESGASDPLLFTARQVPAFTTEKLVLATNTTDNKAAICIIAALPHHSSELVVCGVACDVVVWDVVRCGDATLVCMEILRKMSKKSH